MKSLIFITQYYLSGIGRGRSRQHHKAQQRFCRNTKKTGALPGTLCQQMETAKKEIGVPFEKEQEPQTKSARLHQLNILLNMDKPENEMVDEEPDEDMDIPEKKAVGYER